MDNVNDDNGQVLIGVGPPLRLSDLPSPPSSLIGLIKIIGPSVIVLGMGIGAGEWLLAPAATVKYGVGILWIATIAIIIQTLAFLEAVRYTIYTGEPLTTGIMRLWPGPKFWGFILLVLLVLSLGWPVWAFGAATAIIAAYMGRLPGPQDANLILISGFILSVLIILILSFGGKVVRVLEVSQLFMMIFVLVVMVLLVFAIVPKVSLINVIKGFISFGQIQSSDLLGAALLLGAVAGYAGAGAFANTVISSYYRDKGLGMGAYVGSITTIVGGSKINLSPNGVAFKITDDNLRRWRAWRNIALIDIIGIFTLGSFLGILLPVALAITLLPQGEDIGGWAVAVYQGEALKTIYGSTGWAIILVVGFWVLYSTQLGLTELVVRTATDILWTMSSKIRELTRNDVRKVYYTLLAFMTLWIITSYILFYILKINPLLASALVANMSNIVYPLTVLANLYINIKYLPKEIKPSPIIVAILLVGTIFWLTFFTLFLLSLVLK
ncbi:MAG: Nramp family divalent metal transporter [Acidilobaceae archaeon]